MAFSFGFSGDDIEEDPNDVLTENEGAVREEEESGPAPIPAKSHDLGEMVG
jgi:protein-histidine N-methyltransferase